MTMITTPAVRSADRSALVELEGERHGANPEVLGPAIVALPLLTRNFGHRREVRPRSPFSSMEKGGAMTLRTKERGPATGGPKGTRDGSPGSAPWREAGWIFKDGQIIAIERQGGHVRSRYESSHAETA